MSALETSESLAAMPAQAELPVQPLLALSAQREEELYRRYSRIQKPKPEVVYEFTRDPGLLHQYYQLRGEEYYRSWGETNYTHGPDEYDAKAHILIIRHGNQCVGGVRLIVKTPRSKGLLPVESDDFRLSELLPELNLDNCKYGEYSGFVMLPEFRDGYRDLFLQLYRKGRAIGLKYGFSAATLAQARMYRSISNYAGLDFTMLSDLNPVHKEVYSGQKMCLVMWKNCLVDNKAATAPVLHTLEPA